MSLKFILNLEQTAASTQQTSEREPTDFTQNNVTDRKNENENIQINKIKAAGGRNSY